MTDTSANERVIKPSTAYDEAIDSPVYRLSELMFGSLLAAYILGFIGFLAARWSAQAVTPDKVLLIVEYTSISIAYAYLTASFYVSYHAGILTMHHMPLARLGVDFLLALAQAVFFGLSMVFPITFPILLGALLGAYFIRQRREQNRLVRSFFHKLGGSDDVRRDRGDEDREKAFRRRFIKLLGQAAYSELAVWKPVGFGMLLLAAWLFVMGMIVLYLVSMPKLDASWRIAESWSLNERWIGAELGLVAVVVSVYGHLILRRRATFLYRRKSKTTRMDSQFEKLLEALRESVTGE